MDTSRQCKRSKTKHTFAVPPEAATHAIERVVEATRSAATQELPHSSIVALDTGIYGGQSLQDTLSSAPWRFKKTPRFSVTRQCSLTLRSSGAPTAVRAGQQAQGLRPILRLLPGTHCRRRPLSSNVRPHRSPL